MPGTRPRSRATGATSTRRLLSPTIGSGREIHVGEEAGLGQWRTALEKAGDPGGWTVHAPQAVLQEFFGPRDAAHPTPGSGPHSASSTHPVPLRQAADPALELTVELRFHSADDLDQWVDLLLDGDDPAHARELAVSLERDGYHLRMTRDLEVAKDQPA